MDTSNNGSAMRDELRTDAHTISDSARNRLHREVDARKGNVASQAKAVSSALNRTRDQLGAEAPGWLRSSLDSVARTVDQLGGAIERKDSHELVRDLRQMASQHPTGFLAACASVGFAAARVMRAGADSGSNMGSAQSNMGSAQSRPTMTGGGMSDTPYRSTAIRMQSTSEHYADSLSGGPVR